MGCRVARTLGQLGEIAGGATPSTKKPSYWNGDIPWLSPKDLTNYAFRYIGHGERSITRSGYDNSSTVLLPAGTVLFSSRAPIGYVAIASNPVCTNQGFKSVVPYDGTDSLFLYYLLKFNRGRIEGLGSGTTFKEVSATTMRGIEVDVPRTIDEQRRIASVLDSIDSKIETNARLNGYLEELLLARFKALVPTNDWSEGRAESFFEIGIGKTPPRKEPKWFSNVRKGNCVWLSIKDMAKSGAYSLDSMEYLTLDAVRQKNVRKVPEGSVLLSFKLTVGRVKIAACDMTTNEAIACFSSNDSRRLAYVYPYLLTYDYGKLGSTSSIATAVNSKTIKAMSIAMPDDKELDSFYELSKPLYGQMLCIAKENARLELLRDALLPKLMSGEIDVSKVDLTQLNSHLA